LTPAALRQRFSTPPAWQPEVRREPRFADRAPAPAAVLVPLVDRPGGLSVLLTERTANLSTHSGQIAFPGGKVDAEDASVVDAALREAEEEVDLKRSFVEVIGQLP
ncbi:MAG: CoA pyrophosphatase, partial [Ottowia sp.]|nr:CoA pyrophosphatase [Ottowia sp.]MCB2070493.1 CoA pyrophosphatase [Ottowia sp.]